MKVLAADGYILCSGLLRTLMVFYDDVCVTATNSIDEVMARISEVPDLDLLLLDTSMPGMEDIRALRPIAEKLPCVPIVVTSRTDSRAQVIAAISSGARAFIPVSATPFVLQHALPLIMSGEFYIPASALRAENQHALPATDALLSRTTRPAKNDLTLRQREVAAMLAAGKSNKEIARELKVFEGTVKLHVKGILRKLGVRNRTEAVLAAIRAGYLPITTLGIRAPAPECAAKHVDHGTSGFGAASPPLQPEATSQAHNAVSPAALVGLFRSRRA